MVVSPGQRRWMKDAESSNGDVVLEKDVADAWTAKKEAWTALMKKYAAE